MLGFCQSLGGARGGVDTEEGWGVRVVLTSAVGWALVALAAKLGD